MTFHCHYHTPSRHYSISSSNNIHNTLKIFQIHLEEGTSLTKVITIISSYK